MGQSKTKYPFVVADVGGTNARFALVTSKNELNKTYNIEAHQTYLSRDFNSLDEALSTYLDSLDCPRINDACLAVAGPVGGDSIKVTNLNWQSSLSATKKQFGLNNLTLMNDFAAYAYALNFLDDACLRVIRKGVAIQDNPIAVVGPGTGFGVAMLTSQFGKLNAIALEGGHAALASNSVLEAAIIEKLTHQFERVTIERIFSGQGLQNLYLALGAVEDVQTKELSIAEISHHALNGTDALCRRTLDLFCSWLGSVTGDLALTLGARGGVYLGGGILPRFSGFLANSGFSHSFAAKEGMSNYVEEIPVQLVIEDNSALLGAAAWFDTWIDSCIDKDAN